MLKHSVEMQSDKQQKKLNWDMSRGNWVDADFSGLKNLHEKFNASNMQRCKFNGSDLTNVRLINTFFKNNKKIKRVRFIDCKADRMTYEFLKQGKADLTGITQI